MLYWVILFVLGEVLSDRIPMALIIIILLGYCIFVFRYGSSDKKPLRQKLLAVGALFAVLGIICGIYRKQMTNLCKFSDGDIVSFTGIVVEKQEKYDNRYRLRVSRINDITIHTYIVAETDNILYPGIGVTGSGKAKEYMISTNPGQFDMKSYEMSKGNMIFVENVKVYSVKKPFFNIRRDLARLREKLAGQYDKWLDEQDASLAKAMVLGEKSEIDQDIRSLYQRNGIAHLIAISGLHIAMLGGTFYHALRRISGSFAGAACVGITFIIMYGILTGLSGATVRAIIMLIMSIIADVLGRKYDALTAIAMALLIMLVANPGQVGQAGFLLSFGAVLGIALVYPVLEQFVHTWLEGINIKSSRKKRKVGAAERIVDGLLVSVSVQLAITPILLYFFYEIPLYGIFLNIIVVPLMSVLLFALIVLAISGVMVGKIVGFLYIIKIMAVVAEAIFELYEKLCRLTELFPYHSLCFGRPGMWWMTVYYVLLFMVLVMMKSGRVRLLAGAFFLWSMLFVSFILPGRLMITMFDVGQGDGIYIRTPEGNNILIDGGSSSKRNVGTYVLKCGLEYYGCKHLDYMIVTHSDADHYSGALELLEDSEIGVDNFVLPAITNPDESYYELENAARIKGCKLCYMKMSDTLDAGDVSLKCLNPENISYPDKNSGSIVLWLRYKRFDMLFTGDMDENVESRLLNNDQFTTSIDDGNTMEVLKVAHHGSTTASSEAFLRRTNFDTALISVGERNRYGHPADAVMERLYRYCDHIYLTKESGAITIRTDGDTYHINTYIKTND